MCKNHKRVLFCVDDYFIDMYSQTLVSIPELVCEQYRYYEYDLNMILYEITPTLEMSMSLKEIVKSKLYNIVYVCRYGGGLVYDCSSVLGVNRNILFRMFKVVLDNQYLCEFEDSTLKYYLRSHDLTSYLKLEHIDPIYRRRESMNNTFTVRLGLSIFQYPNNIGTLRVVNGKSCPSCRIVFNCDSCPGCSSFNITNTKTYIYTRDNINYYFPLPHKNWELFNQYMHLCLILNDGVYYIDYDRYDSLFGNFNQHCSIL
jgi:hypothetical protein